MPRWFRRRRDDMEGEKLIGGLRIEEAIDKIYALMPLWGYWHLKWLLTRLRRQVYREKNNILLWTSLGLVLEMNLPDEDESPWIAAAQKVLLGEVTSLPTRQ